MPALVLGLLMVTGPVEAEPVRVGWSEPVSFPRLELQLPAKLDTGARTSSLGGRDLKAFQRGGQEWVAFTLMEGDKRIERAVVRYVTIRRAGAPDQRRPVVRMQICVAGITRSTQFTVTDRRGMDYPVLLGRRFLAGRVVVDAGLENVTEGRCGP